MFRFHSREQEDALVLEPLSNQHPPAQETSRKEE